MTPKREKLPKLCLKYNSLCFVNMWVLQLFVLRCKCNEKRYKDKFFNYISTFLMIFWLIPWKSKFVILRNVFRFVGERQSICHSNGTLLFCRVLILLYWNDANGCRKRVDERESWTPSTCARLQNLQVQGKTANLHWATRDVFIAGGLHSTVWIYAMIYGTWKMDLGNKVLACKR